MLKVQQHALRANPPGQSAGAAAAVDDERSLNKQVVYIKKSVLNEMVRHCMEELPLEGCGLLFETASVVDSSSRIRNTLRSPTAFAMDMAQAASTVKAMKRNNKRMSGIYHSHPTAPAIPSRDDVKHAHYPEAAYFILSFQYGKADVKCYRIRNKKVIPLKMEIIE